MKGYAVVIPCAGFDDEKMVVNEFDTQAQAEAFLSWLRQFLRKEAYENAKVIQRKNALTPR